MSAWPRESDATVALHAAAAKAWDLNRGALPPSMSEVAFDELPKVTQHEIKNSVLAVVWAALAALPDPRREAWAEGLAHAERHADSDRAILAYLDNPYHA